jgi:hypothetical protein|eukprot:COSAG02_NODE_2292_length_9199_cov_45.393956_5_plen_201_part_00
MSDDDVLAGLKLAAARKAAKERQKHEQGGVRALLAAVECAPLPECGPSLKSAVLPCVGSRSAVKAIDRSRSKRRDIAARASPRHGSPRWAACCAAPAGDHVEPPTEKLLPGRVELPSEPDTIDHRVGDFPSTCVREISDARLSATPLVGRRRMHVDKSWDPERDDAAGYLSLREGDTIVVTAETEPDWWSGYVEPREWIV